VVDPALPEQGEQVVDEREDHGVVDLLPQTELGAHTGQPGGAVLPAERAEGLRCECDGLVLVVVEERQQGLGEPGQVPLRHDRLVAVGVAPASSTEL
jgi:hypothetical protein